MATKKIKKPVKKQVRKTVKKSVKFDYTTIKTFEAACKKVGVNPKHLPDVSMLPEDCQKSVIAYYKLIIIYKAINNGWIPDWNNTNQKKWYPYFSVGGSGFGFSVPFYDYYYSYSDYGSRLCCATSEQALFIGKIFEKEYVEYLLYQK